MDNANEQIIIKLADSLGKSLPSDKTQIKVHLVKLDQLRLELARVRVESLKTLHTAEQKILHPKDPHLTELDRRVSLQGMTAELRCNYEYLVALEELVKARTELGIVLLTTS